MKMKTDKTMEYGELEKYTTTDVWNTYLSLPENHQIHLWNSYIEDGKKKLVVIDPKSKEIIKEGLWKGLKKPVIYTPSFYEIDATPNQVWAESKEYGQIAFFAKEEKNSPWCLYKGAVKDVSCFPIYGFIDEIAQKLSAPFVMPDLEGEKNYYKTLAKKIKAGNYLEKNEKIMGMVYDHVKPYKKLLEKLLFK